MGRVLVMLEVSRKQEYVFASQKLRDNAVRSKEISTVTQSAFFESAAGALYSEADNLVYSGGGHAILQFDDPTQAGDFIWAVTKAAMETYHGMELFAKQYPYDPQEKPGKNLHALMVAMEEKKARRKTAIRQLDFGVEKKAEETSRDSAPDVLPAPPGRRYFSTPEEIVLPEKAKKDNFIAVIHIDGNGMGDRSQRVIDAAGDNWEECRKKLRRFSEGIQSDFEAAFMEMTEAVMAAGYDAKILPIRPVVLAGDDVCFVTAGSIGLECARIFLEKLNQKTNCEQPGEPYSACAGVALVHSKYPFHAAYSLAEELCDKAKEFGAELDPQRSVCAMDWHIEFGQLKNSLKELREDYAVEPFADDDGNIVTDARMELRPVAVLVPEGVSTEATGGVRTYSFVKGMLNAMKGEMGKTARGKIKELRTAMKQGPTACRFYMQDAGIQKLLYHVFDAEYQTDEEQLRELRDMLHGKTTERSAYRKVGKEWRCLFFDAIELTDHYAELKEVRE